eukprot:6423118-Lingulodinium_polyedra.AAC.1
MHAEDHDAPRRGGPRPQGVAPGAALDQPAHADGGTVAAPGAPGRRPLRAEALEATHALPGALARPRGHPPEL